MSWNKYSTNHYSYVPVIFCSSLLILGYPVTHLKC